MPPERVRERLTASAANVVLRDDGAGAFEGAKPVSFFGEIVVRVSLAADDVGSRIDVRAEERPRAARQPLALVLLVLACVTVVPLIAVVVLRLGGGSRRARLRATVDDLWRAVDARA